MGATITATLVHPGPSRWSARPAIELRVAWPAPGGDLRGAWRALAQVLASHRIFAGEPEMIGDPGALLELEGRDFEPALAAALAASALQRALAPIPRGDGAPRAGRAPDARVVVFEYLDPVLGRAVGQAGVELAALQIDGPAGEPSVRQAHALLDRLAAWAPANVLPGGSMELTVTARRRGIPIERVAPGVPMVRLGQGARQQWSWIGFTSATSHIATIVASNKHAAHAVLRDAGLPVPEQAMASGLDAARAAARRIGYPVVLKPAATDRGLGVTAAIRDETALEAAYRRARAHGPVLVEKHIDGSDHRLLVIGGRLVRATRRDPPIVTGNGRDSVAVLVRAENGRRRLDRELYDVDIVIDDDVLRRLTDQGLTPESVPAAGRTLALRSNANLSTGGGYLHIDTVHPDNARMAVRAAATIGLDVAGVDFITTDIGRSWTTSGGAICEINPTPHLWRESDAHDRTLDAMFPDGADGRIPIVLVVAATPAAAAWRMRARDRLRRTGGRVGVAWRGRVEIAGVEVTTPGRDPAHALIVDGTVDAAVVERAPDEALDDALAFDRCALAVVAGVPAGAARTALLARLSALADQVWVDPPADALERWDPATRGPRV